MSEPKTRIIRDDSGNLELVVPGVRLSVVEGPDRGAETTAKKSAVRVGAAADNDLVLTDTAVSRRHVEVRVRGDRIGVRDLGSTNGTLLDGVQIIEAVAAPGSLVRVGDTAIRVTPMDEPVRVPLSARERFGRMIGRSMAMREVFAILERVAPTEATVLVQGETGTGKELVAEALHEHSPRSEGPLVTLDCGAVAPTLMESELFGHVRGSFTGATADRAGVFEEAHGGTLFLDEIGELPLELQPKLLRALENREVRRVGESRARPVDVRVVAATNRDLAAEVNRGAFREDLYFRLAVVEVDLPPLRARPEDIRGLVRHFIEQLGYDTMPSAPVVESFSKRAWPGNVRELRNAVERALAMADHDDVQPTEAAAADAGADALLARLLDAPFKDAVDQWTEHFERRYVERALERSGGSVSGAARLTGLNRRHVQRLMKRTGVRRDEDD